MEATEASITSKKPCCANPNKPEVHAGPNQSGLTAGSVAARGNLSPAFSSPAAPASSSCCGPKVQPASPCCTPVGSKDLINSRWTLSRSPFGLALNALAIAGAAFTAWIVISELLGVKTPVHGLVYFVGEAGRIISFVARAAWNLLPYFVVCVALAGWLKVSGLTAKIQQVFEQRQLQAIVMSTLLGALTPFCSCGVIPIIASMLVAGVPLAPVMSFWISSPLMNPQVFFITMGTMGTSMALARLISALFMGLAAGFVTQAFDRMGYLHDQLRPGLSKGCGCSSEPSGPLAPQPDAARSSFPWRSFMIETGDMAIFLGKWLLVAFVLEALITFYVPGHWISQVVGSRNQYSVLIATLVGIPMYLNSLAAIPVVQALITSGMDKGAALAFFTAGAVTTVPAMVAVLALVRRTTFGLYLAISFFGALAVGTFYGMMP